WTPMRLEQREGRSARLGGRHRAIDIVEWEPWPGLEKRMRQLERLATKRAQIRAAGLDEASHWLYRWRSEFRSAPAAGSRIAAVTGREAGWLVAIDLGGVELLWIPDQGDVDLTPERNIERLNAARVAQPDQQLNGLDGMRERLAGWVRAQLRQRLASDWT